MEVPRIFLPARGAPPAVILSEAKDLSLGRAQILRFAQDDNKKGRACSSVQEDAGHRPFAPLRVTAGQTTSPVHPSLTRGRFIVT